MNLYPLRQHRSGPFPSPGAPREPLYHLPEIAEQLGITHRELQGLIRQFGNSPKPVREARNQNDHQNYYRVSEYRAWYSYVHQLPHPRHQPQCLEAKEVKPQRILMSTVRKLYNEKVGGHWFDSATTSFWKTKFPNCAVQTPYGNYFVTTETDLQDLKRHSVRRQDLETGDIETLGEFHSFVTYEEARAAMWTAINQAHYAARLPIDEAEDQRELAAAMH